VDAVHPESEVSRQFSLSVDQFVAGSCKNPALAAALRARLTKWAAIDGQVQPLAQNSILVKDAAAASAAFSQAAEIALTAVDRIAEGLPLPDALKKQQTDALAAFETEAHKSTLTIPSLAAFQKLVDASGTGGACSAAK